MAEKFLAGGYGYGDAKKELFEVVWNYFAPFRSRREELSKDPGLVTEIRKKGAQKARAVALDTMDKVRKLVGITG